MITKRFMVSLAVVMTLVTACGSPSTGAPATLTASPVETASVEPSFKSLQHSIVGQLQHAGTTVPESDLVQFIDRACVDLISVNQGVRPTTGWVTDWALPQKLAGRVLPDADIVFQLLRQSAYCYRTE